MMDPITPDVVATVVALVLSAHEDSGTCRQCTPDGCPDLSWALKETTKARAESHEMDENHGTFALIQDGRTVGYLHLSPDGRATAHTATATVVCQDLDQFRRFWTRILHVELDE